MLGRGCEDKEWAGRAWRDGSQRERGTEGRAVASVSQSKTTDRGWIKACGQWAVKYIHKIYLHQPYAPCGRAARTGSERRAEEGFA